MSKPYTTELDVENYLTITIDPSFATQLGSWINAMSRWCDKYANRTLYDDESTTMLYDGELTDLMLIDDVVDITEVKVDGVVIDPADYYKYPQNKGYTSRIALKNGNFTSGRQNVSVTGKHAMSKTLPDDVKFACTVLVAGIVNSSILGNKKGTTEKIGGYSITYKTDAEANDFLNAKQILSGYKRIAL